MINSKFKIHLLPNGKYIIKKRDGKFKTMFAHF